MTTNPNSWTDGYGTVHPGAPPDGYWVASDDRWYAPELHPDYRMQPTTLSEPTGPSEPIAHAEPVLEPGQKQAIVREPAGPATFDVTALESVLADLETTEQASPSDWAAPTAATAGAETAAPGPTADGPGPVAPTATPEPSSTNPIADSPGPGNRILTGAVVGILAVLGIGAAAWMAFSGDDETSVIAGESPAILANADNGDQSSAAESDAQQEFEAVNAAINGEESASSESVEPAADGADAGADASPALAGINSCTRIDDQTLAIDMTNVSDETASYLMTVIYTDDAGVRVGDDTAYISSLRPDERTLEAVYVFSDAGTGCEVIDMERYARNGTDGLADISTCTVRAPEEASFLEADIAVTNSGAATSDYTVEVALVDPDGVRKGWGTAYVEKAPVGEAVAGEIYTTVPYDETYQCEVVAVTRLESP